MKYDEWEKPKPCGKLNRFLASAEGALNFAELANFWHTTRVTFTFRRPPDLEGGIRLPGVIRGALGPPLRRIAEREPDHPFGSLFHMMYADHFVFEKRWHTPKPFVIWVEDRNGRIFVQISLFGIAGAFREHLVEAMLAVMQPVSVGGEGGITIMDGKQNRRIWPIEDIYWQDRGHFPVSTYRDTCLLGTLTPVITSNDNFVSNDLKQIFSTIFKRIRGLALWQGVMCSPSFGFDNIDKAMKNIRLDLIASGFKKRERRSRSFSTVARHHVGLKQTILVSDLPEILRPGLLIGTMTHIGYEVPQGYGRYEIFEL